MEALNLSHNEAELVYTTDQLAAATAPETATATEPEQPVDDSDDDILDGLFDDEVTTEDKPEPSAAFTEQFEQHFGMTVDDAKALMEDLSALRQEREAYQVYLQHQQLATHWDVPQETVAQRLTEVAKVWNKLPDDKKQKLDNIDGVKAIWARIETKGGKSTPKLDKSAAKATAQSKYLFTQSQIDSMSDAEYAQNRQAIANAYAQGKVKK
jgi:hypothetical protein